MRVMHVIEAMHQGGAESLVVEHARLAAPDIETEVCALNRGGPALEAARATGAEVRVLGSGGLTRLLALARRMRETRVDVVHGHNPTGGLYGALAARLAGVPAVLRTEHSFHFAGRHSRFYPALERVSTALTGRVICVCEAVRASHASRLGGDPARFVVVLNGVAEPSPVRPRADTRRALGLADDAPLVLTVGSLTRQKAQHLLIEAMALPPLNGAHLWIAGEGPLRADLERRRDTLGLAARVSFLGARGDVGDLLAACDVFVLSSSREGLSVTLLEAMRAACPAVATRVGGNAEAVLDGVTGLIVPPGQAGALAVALGELLGDADRRSAFGRAGRERWAALFSAERMVRETETLYRALLDRRSMRPLADKLVRRGNAA
ncbi:MAG: glycosyltransferase [Candidatus Eisenbacteria bacterium]